MPYLIASTCRTEGCSEEGIRKPGGGMWIGDDEPAWCMFCSQPAERELSDTPPPGYPTEPTPAAAGTDTDTERTPQ